MMKNTAKIQRRLAIIKLLAFMVLWLGIPLLTTCLSADLCYAQATSKGPTLSIDLNQTDAADNVVPALKIVGLLTILAVAPAILLMMTSFTRILIVLSFVRQALGTQTMPPNQIVVGLALFLTYFTMSPVIDTITKNALNPFIEKTISQEQAFQEAIKPVRKFMLRETRKDDIGLFLSMAKLPKPQSEEDLPFSVVLPSFMISELTTAFQIGFLVYIPFLVIDMVVSSILMAMGMMMLPPTIVSLPFKLVIFVLVDGWALISDSIVKSFAAG